MKALVTGGAGFVGSHLTEALNRNGASVVVLDNLRSGHALDSTWNRLAGVDFVEGDIRDDALVARLMPGCDWVFHQAALPSVPQSIRHPLETNDNNIDGTLRVLLAARDAGVKRFVFASSSSIYGNTDAPVKHEDLPPNPLSPYALQKYAGERYCQLFHQLYGLPTVSLRYFNPFGPRQRHDSPYSGVIARFCNAFARGERPTIYGDGLQNRDFTYIDDVVSANLLAAQAPVERVAGRVFNVARGDSINLLQVIAELQNVTGRCLEPHIRPGRSGDVRNSRADITAARDALAYEPVVPFAEGLRRTFNCYDPSNADGAASPHAPTVLTERACF
jgi:nucleoside-diphosphate-sugar epimerase